MPKGEMPSSSKRRKVDGSSSPPDREKPKPSGSINKEKLDKVISAYGVLPLSDCGLAKPNEPTPETILALVFLAMLTSARISHVLAYKSVLCLIEAGYQNVETLKNSTWQERTEVLTKGGYTRYREKTATSLGELADFVVNKYGEWVALSSKKEY